MHYLIQLNLHASEPLVTMFYLTFPHIYVTTPVLPPPIILHHHLFYSHNVNSFYDF